MQYRSYKTTRNCKHRRAAAKPTACASFLLGPNLAWDSGPVVYALRLISSGSVYCISHAGRKITWFIYEAFCAHPKPRTNLGKICQEIVDQQTVFTCQISSKSIYCVTFQRQNTAILANVDIRGWLGGGGLLYSVPLTNEDLIWDTRV